MFLTKSTVDIWIFIIIREKQYYEHLMKSFISSLLKYTIGSFIIIRDLKNIYIMLINNNNIFIHTK